VSKKRRDPGAPIPGADQVSVDKDLFASMTSRLKKAPSCASWRWKRMLQPDALNGRSVEEVLDSITAKEWKRLLTTDYFHRGWLDTALLYCDPHQKRTLAEIGKAAGTDSFGTYAWAQFQCRFPFRLHSLRCPPKPPSWAHLFTKKCGSTLRKRLRKYWMREREPGMDPSKWVQGLTYEDLTSWEAHFTKQNIREFAKLRKEHGYPLKMPIPIIEPISEARARGLLLQVVRQYDDAFIRKTVKQIRKDLAAEES